MQTLFLHSWILMPLQPLPGRRNIGFHQRSRPSNLVIALKRDEYEKNQNRSLVDENMIVLKMRIQELKMAEESSAAMPENRMEWEKQYNYHLDIFKAVGILQVLLMETRPSLALGMLACILFSVSTSLLAVASMLINMANSNIATHITL